MSLTDLVADSSIRLPESDLDLVVRTDDSSLFDRLWRRGAEIGVAVRKRAALHSEPSTVVDLRGSSDVPEALAGRLPARWDRKRPLVLSADGHVFVYSTEDLDALLRRARAVAFRRRVELTSILRGRSEAMRELRSSLERVATFEDVNVFVHGPTGAGKELVARALHELAAARGRFVPLNCASLPKDLLESELFGHRRGAFTGARERTGLLESATDGTLFLDEIAEMSLEMQAKLLRAIETRRVRPVGGNEERPFRARFVAATNQRLRPSVMRRDLFYRLAGVTLRIPPLRRRPEDILDLAPHFLSRFCWRQGLPDRELAPSAIEALQAHTWPGNVRELKSVMEQVAIQPAHRPVQRADVERVLTESQVLTTSSLPPRRSTRPPSRLPAQSLPTLEREITLRTLRHNEGNVARTARDLGIPRSTLRARLRRYEEERGDGAGRV
ncbi:MAG TPA: sigma-54 dependent transcriptional regulator [Sandaracinaceae bacterium LLY-WYZ-13_1]|nr:sigma-54 dependent transcriptional regulator [Sandaracinaceae bacterium LLY-WYZ-13_1]